MNPGEPQEAVRFGKLESTDPYRVSKIISSQDSASAELRDRCISLVSSVITGDDSPRISISQDFVLLLLYILRSIDENLLSVRIANMLRDTVQRSVAIGAPEDMESYCSRMGLDMTFDPEIKELLVSIPVFVKYCSRISGFQYRLVSQVLYKGQVILRQDTASHIAREFFAEQFMRLYQSMETQAARKVLTPYSEFISTAKREYAVLRSRSKVDLGNVESAKFPPCILEYIRQVREGVNLPHMARFTMVSFLHKIGMGNPEIMEIFKSAPDFNEKITEYQVNHITGEISGTQYSPPKCAVLQSNHICYKGNDPLCAQEWLKHPLRYYLIKKKPRQKSGN